MPAGSRIAMIPGCPVANDYRISIPKIDVTGYDGLKNRVNSTL